MMIITDEIFVAYSQCPLKAHLLTFSPEPSTFHEYQQILEQHRISNQRKHLQILGTEKSDVAPYCNEYLEKGHKLLIGAKLTAEGLEASCDLLTMVNGKYYEPTIFTGTQTVRDTDKLRILFIGYVLAQVQGSVPVTGHIITSDSKHAKVKLEKEHKKFKSVLDQLREWVANASPLLELPVVLNKHCPMCQFRDRCQAKVTQDDNLSRLVSITPRMIRRYERKGIFTVKQLSYLFKPRRRKKRSKNPPSTTHNVELQALAIRMNRIYTPNGLNFNFYF
jgi:predicted RecB family nuclease